MSASRDGGTGLATRAALIVTGTHDRRDPFAAVLMDPEIDAVYVQLSGAHLSTPDGRHLVVGDNGVFEEVCQ